MAGGPTIQNTSMSSRDAEEVPFACASQTGVSRGERRRPGMAEAPARGRQLACRERQCQCQRTLRWCLRSLWCLRRLCVLLSLTFFFSRSPRGHHRLTLSLLERFVPHGQAGLSWNLPFAWPQRLHTGEFEVTIDPPSTVGSSPGMSIGATSLFSDVHCMHLTVSALRTRLHRAEAARILHRPRKCRSETNAARTPACGTAKLRFLLYFAFQRWWHSAGSNARVLIPVLRHHRSADQCCFRCRVTVGHRLRGLSEDGKRAEWTAIPAPAAAV